MSSVHAAIVRVVLNRPPPARANKDGTNAAGVTRMLMRAFRRKGWPVEAAFAITPGGFVLAPFPADYCGQRGWATRSEDFKLLIPCATRAVQAVLTEELLAVAAHRADFLTLGVDLNSDGWKGRSLHTRGPHAELVAVVDTADGNIVQWTGKSYPTNGQERMLVQQPDLKTHLFRCKHGRILVLGCHDLHMFSERARSTQGPERRSRCDAMRRLTKALAPSVILHHPHSTDSPDIWRDAWRGACTFLPPSSGRQRHAWASAISNICWKGGNPRKPLPVTLAGTACCDRVTDILLS